MSYAWGCFYSALHCLVGPSTLKERLSAACLNFEYLESESLPCEIQDEYRKFIRDVTRLPAFSFDVSVRLSINSMSSEKLQQNVTRILQMHEAFRREPIAPETLQSRGCTERHLP